MKVYFLGDVIVALIFRVICYGIGRVVIAGFTFGKVHSADFKDTYQFQWHGLAKASDGTYVLSAEATVLVGFVTVVLAIVLGVIVYKI